MKYKNKKRKILMLFSFVIIIISIALSILLILKNKYDKQINRISVSSTPNDTQYYVGEELNLEGLSIIVIRNNEDFYHVDASKCEVSGFDSSKAVERQIITVSYKGFTCTFSVSIIDYPKPTPVLQSIYLETLPKTEYKVGESLDTTGGVIIRVYKDGSSARINLVNSYVYGFNTSTPGTYALTVIYIENGLQAQTSYEIVVSE